MQMHRMWIFAWDHNVRQSYRVLDLECSCRAIEAGMSERQPDGPPVRWRKGQKHRGPVIAGYAKLDLSFSGAAR